MSGSIFQKETCSEDPDAATGDSNPYSNVTISESEDSYNQFGSYTENGTTYDETSGNTSYSATINRSCAPDGGFPDLVTGHTVYAKFLFELDLDVRIVIEREVRDELGLATDFAAIAGFWLEDIDIDIRVDLREKIKEFAQRECVVWFNGENLNQEPDGDNFHSNQSFASDEDENSDAASQDYDFDRDVNGCGPWVDQREINETLVNISIEKFFYGSFAVAVEQGDCDPRLGSDFRFRGHLDFIDPNRIYHEVQEYDYVCADGTVASAVKDLFPWTGTDPQNTQGCDAHKVAPAAGATGGSNDSVLDDDGNVSAGGAWVNYGLDLGHKCNGSIQDLFTERLWITRTHAPQLDPTVGDYYTFALLVDTCDGLNAYDLNGKPGTHYSDGFNRTGPGDYPIPGYGGYSVSQFEQDPTGTLGEVKRCTDGSSFSFDDTNRGDVTHAQTPQGVEEIMRGNSIGGNGTVPAGKHREDCRYDTGALNGGWPYNGAPPQTDQGHCYPEDHQTAAVDIYVLGEDPTGLFEMNSGGRSAAWAGSQSANYDTTDYVHPTNP